HSAIRSLPPFPTRRSSDLSNFNARLQPECHPFACNGPSAATRSATSFATRISDSTSFWSTSKSPSYSATLRLRDELDRAHAIVRSEEHTSELQSQSNLVCR